MKIIFRRAVALAAAATMLGGALSGCSGGKTKTALDPDNPVTVNIWNYYNGDQLAAFETLVDEFNETVGAEKGIVAVSESQGDITTLADSLIDAVSGKAGAKECPTLASIYSETAYILDQSDALVNLDDYFTADELSAYIPGFVEEGRFNADNELLLFPILKSTEIFTANKTDWQAFADASGITIDSIKTQEDLVDAAKAYYEWTDALTPDTAEDGKALYGRDSMANYICLGSYQLGHDMFKIENGEVKSDISAEVFKTLWDNYYIPYINGYFGAYANFRSEDAKTGKILALTSSSSGISYLPTQVTSEDDTTHDIEMYIGKSLPFADAVNDAVVQQGASYCLLKSTDAEQEGAVEFIKWFTDPERNTDFALMSGYSPVTAAANTAEAISAAYSGDTTTVKGKNVLDALLVSADVYTNNDTYSTKAFAGSKDVRTLLESAMSDTAKADRATVESLISQGMTREEATAQFSTDEYFNEWFNSLCDQINEIIGD